MARKIVRCATVIATTAALSFGMAGAASAQSPLGSLSRVTGSLGNSDLGVPTGEKVRLGNVGGPAWNADVYTQVFGNSRVAPGANVKIRVEIVGVKDETAIRELRQSMPAGFNLTKVETMKSGLLGNSPTVLKQSEYTNVSVGDRQEARVSLEEGLLFKSDVKVSTSRPLIVDFTWKAPQQEGEYSIGAGATVGAVINPSKNFTDGGTVTVAKPTGQSGLGSSNLTGSLGGFGKLGSS